MKESYDILTEANIQPTEQKWGKLWQKKLWPKITIFSWPMIKNRILTHENLKKGGMVGPYRSFLCELEDKTTSHLLDTCKSTCSIGDHEVEIFRRPYQVRKNPVRIITKWSSNPFQNSIINHLWENFPPFHSL